MLELEEVVEPRIYRALRRRNINDFRTLFIYFSILSPETFMREMRGIGEVGYASIRDAIDYLKLEGAI